MRFVPYAYQTAGVRWIMDRPRCCLFWEMGLGKTAVTLTAVRRLIDCGEVCRVLVVAPKRVAETVWCAEAAEWDHLRGLRVSAVTGTARRRAAALERAADVYVIGRDSLVWLAGRYGGRLPFDMLVIDELTGFKSPRSLRFKTMRAVSPCFRRVVGLTGTPAPNGLIDLWAQMYCIDRGERLGGSLSRYREAYFDTYRLKWNNIIVRCDVREGCGEIIRARIADICLSMRAEDYLQLPGMVTRTVRIRLPERVMAAYTRFERERILELTAEYGDSPASIPADSAAGLMSKLCQYANGAVYDGDMRAHRIHGEKADMLAEIAEAADGGVLVFYQYRHDVRGITERLGDRDVRVYRGADDLRDWNEGRIRVLLAHPASTAYGLNMQRGGHYIVWYGTGWNLELYQQANARLHRQGQRRPVTVYRLVCAGTADELAAASIDRKSGLQQGLMEGLGLLMRRHHE